MFHYTAWPDHGVPKDPSLLFEICHSLSQLNVNCTVVHCSAGVGRTGVFIALMKLLEVCQSNACYLNVFQTVLDLRKNRKFMVGSSKNILKNNGKLMIFIFFHLKVMNATQYKFLYSAISTYMNMLEEG